MSRWDTLGRFCLLIVVGWIAVEFSRLCRDHRQYCRQQIQADIAREAREREHLGLLRLQADRIRKYAEQPDYRAAGIH